MVRPAFGVRLPVAGPMASVENIRRVAQTAEELGFDAGWVHDYIIWDDELNSLHLTCGSAEALESSKVPNFFESLTGLSFLSGITRKLKLGVTVLILPYRNPLLTARQITNVDQFSGGRLILGVGAGALKKTKNKEFEVLRIKRKDKYLLTEEYLRTMLEIWERPSATFHGRDFSFDSLPFYPKPAQQPHPPIWVGGSGEKAQRIAARYGDGWLPPWISEKECAEGKERILRMAAEMGVKKESGFTIGKPSFVSIDTRSDAARKNASATFTYLLRSSTARTLEQMYDVNFVGSPDEIVRKIQGYADAGASHFEMKFIYPNVEKLMKMMDVFSREVIGSFK